MTMAAKSFGLMTLMLLAAALRGEEKRGQITDGAELGITIMGSIVQQDVQNNVALIKELESGKVRAVKVGHLLLDKYSVIAITGKSMLLKKGEEKILVYQDKFAGEFLRGDPGPDKPATPMLTAENDHFQEDGFERKSGQITMSAAYRDKIVNEDLGKILMQATAEPQTENGQIVGFKLSQIDNGSIFWKGGLKDEDVITEINGQKLDSVAKAVALLRTLKQENAVEVGLLRGGAPTKITLKVH